METEDICLQVRPEAKLTLYVYIYIYIHTVYILLYIFCYWGALVRRKFSIGKDIILLSGKLLVRGLLSTEHNKCGVYSLQQNKIMQQK